MTEYRKQPMTPYERMQKQKLHRLRVEALLSRRRAAIESLEITRQIQEQCFGDMQRNRNEAF